MSLPSALPADPSGSSEETHVIVAAADVSLRGPEHRSVTTIPQSASAIDLNFPFGGHSVPASSRPETVGGVESLTVMLVPQEREFLEPSVAVQVMLLVPRGKVPDPGVQETATSPQLSDAWAVTWAPAALPPVHSRI